MTITTQPRAATSRYLQDNFAPVHRGADRHRPRRHRGAARLPRRPLPAHRPQPGCTTRASATTGSSARAWCTACACATAGPSGTATAGSARPASPRSSASRSAAPRRRRLRGQHQRARARRAHARARRGRLAAVRADATTSRPSGRATSAAPAPRSPGRSGYTAHPHEDPATGELHALSYSWTRGNRVDYSVLDTDGRIRRSIEIEVHGSPMIHDFALTEQHVVIFDLPGHLRRRHGDRRRAAAGATARARAAQPGHRPQSGARAGDRLSPRAAATRGRRCPTRWNPDYPARIGLLPRDGRRRRDVRWFEIDPCYVFHTLNAYDDGDTVVVDVVRHPTDVRDRARRARTRARRADPLHPRPGAGTAQRARLRPALRRSSRGTTSG